MRMGGDFLIEGDDEIGYTAVKNGATFHELLDSDLHYHVFTDGRGSRVNKQGDQTTDQVDLMTVGCSFSWGYGIENEMTYTQILAEEMDVSVCNLAMIGYGTLQSLQILNRNLDLKPKLIIYGFINEHLRRNLCPCAPGYLPYCYPIPYVDFNESNTPYTRLPDMQDFSFEFYRKYFKEILMKEQFDFDDVLWRMRADLFRFIKRDDIAYKNDSHSRQESISFIIKQMMVAARGINARLVIMYIPDLFMRDYVPPPPPELVNSLSDEVFFLDLTQRVRGYYNNEDNPMLTFGEDTHPNSLAHKIFADEIIRFLREGGIFDELAE